MPPKNYTPIDHLVKKHKQELAKIKTKSFYKTQDKGKPKEAEPFMRPKEKYHLQEAVEHQPEEEVEEFVKPRAETIQLPPDLEKIGVVAKNTTNFPVYQNVKLPISDEKVLEYLHKPITTSARWLATLAEYLLAQAHLILKVINGRVTRVVKT